MVLFLNIMNIYVYIYMYMERKRREILLYISPRQFQLKDVTHHSALQRLNH